MVRLKSRPLRLALILSLFPWKSVALAAEVFYPRTALPLFCPLEALEEPLETARWTGGGPGSLAVASIGNTVRCEESRRLALALERPDESRPVQRRLMAELNTFVAMIKKNPDASFDFSSLFNKKPELLLYVRSVNTPNDMRVLNGLNALKGLALLILDELRLNPERAPFDDTLMRALHEAIDAWNHRPVVGESQDRLSLEDLFVLHCFGKAVIDVATLLALAREEVRLPGLAKYTVTAYHALHQAIHIIRQILSNEAVDFDLLIAHCPFLLETLDMSLPPEVLEMVETAITQVLVGLLPYWTDWHDMLSAAMQRQVHALRAIFKNYGKEKLLRIVRGISSLEQQQDVPLYTVHRITANHFFGFRSAPALSDILLRSRWPAHQAVLKLWNRQGLSELFPVQPARPYDPRVAYQRLLCYLQRGFRRDPVDSKQTLSWEPARDVLQRLRTEEVTPRNFLDFAFALTDLSESEARSVLALAMQQVPVDHAYPSFRTLFEEEVALANRSSFVLGIRNRLSLLMKVVDGTVSTHVETIPRDVLVEMVPWILENGYFEAAAAPDLWVVGNKIRLYFSVGFHQLTEDRRLNALRAGARFPQKSIGRLPRLMKNEWLSSLLTAEAEGRLARLDRLDVEKTLSDLQQVQSPRLYKTLAPLFLSAAA